MCCKRLDQFFRKCGSTLFTARICTFKNPIVRISCMRVLCALFCLYIAIFCKENLQTLQDQIGSDLFDRTENLSDCCLVPVKLQGTLPHEVQERSRAYFSRIVRLPSEVLTAWLLRYLSPMNQTNLILNLDSLSPMFGNNSTNAFAKLCPW